MNKDNQHDRLEYLINKYELYENGLPAFGDLRTTKDRFRDALTTYINQEIAEARIDELEKIYDQWHEEGGRKIGKHIKDRLIKLEGNDVIQQLKGFKVNRIHFELKVGGNGIVGDGNTTIVFDVPIPKEKDELSDKEIREILA